MTGKLIIFSAPSGSGKTTIYKRLFEKGLPLEFSVSACSRPMRQGEVNGRDYYFMSAEEFQKRIENDEFIEWQEVYAGSYYGTLKSELDRIWAQGRHVVFDLDVLGGVNIKKIFAERALAIFIQPPSLEELEKRLINRSTETPETLKKRLDRARMELTYAPLFDVCIVNDDLEKAVAQAEKLVTDFIKQ
ncbi:MAG: Guanylate kinase [Bacteroidetes bacterium ADurb.Bin408]|nr:MAG: Guanylate kinase [Bacteroidetes bacterium ADurb.Bin408]